MPDLLDTSVWLVLSLPDHPHHERALAYWQNEADAELAFCRVTMLGLLRLLTHPKVTGGAQITGQRAWSVLGEWLKLPGIRIHTEPEGLDEILAGFAEKLYLRRGHWTDAYLAAFAVSGGYRLVSFDADFARYPGLRHLLLKP